MFVVTGFKLASVLEVLIVTSFIHHSAATFRKVHANEAIIVVISMRSQRPRLLLCRWRSQQKRLEVRRKTKAHLLSRKAKISNSSLKKNLRLRLSRM